MSHARLKFTAKILIPVAIGIGVVVWLFGREFELSSIKEITLSSTTAIGLFMALAFTFGRDFGLAWRFRALTDSRLRWRSSAKVTMLCEFTSAITPTSVGGSALSMIFLGREGIPIGRATAITLTTLFLDEMFFVIFCPLSFLIISPHLLFGFTDGNAATDLRTAFWIVYGIILLIAAGLFIGIFFTPRGIARALGGVFSLPVIRRWRQNVIELGDNLVETSREIKGKPIGWWTRPVCATVVSWLSRFLVVNALFFAFIPECDQLTVFGRQLIVWALLTFTPTPGGSGVSEMLFKTYYSDIVTGPIMMVLAIGWRILTYYIYLLIGFCMIPSFLNLKKPKQNNGKD